MVISNGKIIDIGDTKDIKNKYSGKEEMDGTNKFVYPGFYDAHCHFLKYGITTLDANLSGTKSWEEVLLKLTEFATKNPQGWIKGRGWDQNDWNNKEFPGKNALDSLFPDRPCFLKRIDGHAAIVNTMALTISGIKKGQKVNGGEIIYSEEEPTGILLDNAMDLVENLIPKPTNDEIISALLSVEKECFSYGLTTVADAGLDKKEIDLIDSLQKQGKLKMKVYAMANPDSINLKYYSKHGIYKTDLLHVSSFKIVADGALGSRGACLKKDYSDKPGHKGFLLQPPSYFKEIVDKIFNMGFQMNTHCIGDSANSFMLTLYGEKLKTNNDKRWRIEHVQVIDTSEMKKFANYSIIPSIQFTHATSDMYWAKERLGEERLTGAYAYNKLLTTTGIIANGSDFPVEKINPLLGFYAGVTRKDTTGFPKNGYNYTDAVTRKNALPAMTIWTAFACFEEKERGSLEIGKAGDFVILDKDILKVDDRELYKVNVLTTFVNGVRVYEKNK